MVPNGWTAGKVSDVIQSLESGVSVNGEDRKLEPNELGVLKVSAVSYGYFNPIACKAINIEEIARAKINPKKGQVIISRSNTPELVGASAYIDKDYSHLFLPDKLWQTIPNPDQNMKWLSYVLALPSSRYYLSDLATGTSSSMKNITQEAFLSLKLLIPSVPEQQKIAEILSTWDKAITSTENLIANSEMQKKALMQQLLTGKKRLLDENAVRFSGEWKKTTLGEIANIDSGYAFKSSDFIDNAGIPIIRMSDLKSGTISKDNLAKVNEFITLNLSKFSLQQDDFIFGMSGSLNNYARVYASDLPAFLNQRVGRIRAKNDNYQIFVMYLYLSDAIQKQILNKAAGAAQLNISVNDLRNMQINLPNPKEQEKIAEVLSHADREIELLQAKLEHLKQEKKALMQQLLTGKRRVKVN